MEEPNLSNGSNVDDGGDGGKGSSPSSYLDLIVEGLLVADDPYGTFDVKCVAGSNCVHCLIHCFAEELEQRAGALAWGSLADGPPRTPLTTARSYTPPPVHAHLHCAADTYKNWRIIGHGGTAEVYKANRTDDDHVSVAIKKFRPQSTGGVTLDDIGNELRTLQSVHAHDHINTYIEGYVWVRSSFIHPANTYPLPIPPPSFALCPW